MNKEIKFGWRFNDGVRELGSDVWIEKLPETKEDVVEFFDGVFNLLKQNCRKSLAAKKLIPEIPADMSAKEIRRKYGHDK